MSDTRFETVICWRTRNPDVKKGKYTIAEMIRLTEGQYGSETFKEFFYKR